MLPPYQEYERMIAEGTESPSHGREPQPGPGNPSGTLRIPAMDASPVARGRLTAAPEGGVERAAAALKPRMRGWLHAGVFPWRWSAASS